MCRNELVGPGKEHEQRGPLILEECGAPKTKPRFAYTHGNWAKSERLQIEDLLVAIADNVWKDTPNEQLENTIVGLLTTTSGKERWSCYFEWDEILGSLAEEADERLAWQAEFNP